MGHLDLIFPLLLTLVLSSMKTMCRFISVFHILFILKLITHVTLQSAWLLVIFCSSLLVWKGGKHLRRAGGKI